MNEARLPTLDHKEVIYNIKDRIKIMIERIESGRLRAGDNLGKDDLQIMAVIGYPSSVIGGIDELLKLLNEKFDQL